MPGPFPPELPPPWEPSRPDGPDGRSGPGPMVPSVEAQLLDRRVVRPSSSTSARAKDLSIWP
jgi:hypothetical protein